MKAVDFAGNETIETRTLNLQKAWPTVSVTVYDKKTSFSIKPEGEESVIDDDFVDKNKKKVEDAEDELVPELEGE